jgi:hypothetical protein
MNIIKVAKLTCEELTELAGLEAVKSATLKAELTASEALGKFYSELREKYVPYPQGSPWGQHFYAFVRTRNTMVKDGFLIVSED